MKRCRRFAQVPPRVDYELTDLGHSLLEPIVAVGDWAEVHVDRITAAQAAYDAAHQRATEATAGPISRG